MTVLYSTVMFYMLLAGNLFGSGVGGHALRLTTLTTSGVPFAEQKTRYFVAAGAILMYGLGANLALIQNPGALVIAIGGPILGLSTILLSGKKPDAFQVVLGLPQLVSAVYALIILSSLL